MGRDDDVGVPSGHLHYFVSIIHLSECERRVHPIFLNNKMADTSFNRILEVFAITIEDNPMGVEHHQVVIMRSCTVVDVKQ